MKTSQCCRAVEDSACLKPLSDRSDDRTAGGRLFHVAGPLTVKLCPVAVRARGTSRVLVAADQIADADDLRWQWRVRRGH